jgi:hypothetical protein
MQGRGVNRDSSAKCILSFNSPSLVHLFYTGALITTV